MHLHLVDATWELFKAYFAMPSIKTPDGAEAGAVLGALSSVVSLLGEPGVTHVGCATDRVITSWRNREFAGYKTGDDVEPALLAQFAPLEDGLAALGVTLWPMVEFEADDAIGTAVHRLGGAFERVFVCATDKDFAQLVDGRRVVMLDRKKGVETDEDAVRAKWGVPPASIPDWLALVGDAADGLPGVPGWGPKSAAAVLAAHGHVADVPRDPGDWRVAVRGAARLAENLNAHRDAALLYRRLATLSTDAPVPEGAEDLRWRGPSAAWPAFCARMGFKRLRERAEKVPARGA